MPDPAYSDYYNPSAMIRTSNSNTSTNCNAENIMDDSDISDTGDVETTTNDTNPTMVCSKRRNHNNSSFGVVLGIILVLVVLIMIVVMTIQIVILEV